MVVSNTKKFIEKSIVIHGDKYNYDYVDYKKAIDKVIIECSIHGTFSITPNSHLNGSGCYFCGREKVQSARKLTNKDFIERAVLIHGDLYDYSRVEYKSYMDYVEIGCKKHGFFKQKVSKHLDGQSCKKCISESNYVDFISICKDKFEGYSYDKVDYKGMYNDVIITCNKHGDFKTKPVSFLHKERVDLGLKDLYTDSNNYSSGRFSKKLIKKYHKRISDLGRSLSNKKRGSIRYQKTKKHLSKTHKRLYNTLDDYLDKKSNILLNNKQTYISLGNINIESIIKKNSGNYTKKGLIKSFYSNGLGKFKQMVIDKSTRLKKIIILVDEKDTTKTCSCCGHKKVMELKERNYNCLNCGNSIGRDYNSSINMKLLGSSILSGCPDDFVLKYIEEHNISQNNKK